MATKEEFGMRLAKLRTAANISAREMSLAIGQNASYINRIVSIPIKMSTFFGNSEHPFPEK